MNEMSVELKTCLTILLELMLEDVNVVDTSKA